MSRQQLVVRQVLSELELMRERRLFVADVDTPLTDEDKYALHVDCPACGVRRGRRCEWAATNVELSARAHPSRVSCRWIARLSANDIELIDGRVESYVDPFLLSPTLRARPEVWRYDAREWRERFSFLNHARRRRRLW